MKFFFRIVYFLLAVTLAACQAPPQQAPSTWSSPSGEVKPGPKTTKAVLALIRKARQASKDGKLAKAESHIERALRIEPRNASLWLYMSKLRLYASKLPDAIQLAKKAMALGQSDDKLRMDAWLVIAHAYLAEGKREQAEYAQEQARKFDK